MEINDEIECALDIYEMAAVSFTFVLLQRIVALITVM